MSKREIKQAKKCAKMKTKCGSEEELISTENWCDIPHERYVKKDVLGRCYDIQTLINSFEGGLGLLDGMFPKPVYPRDPFTRENISRGNLLKLAAQHILTVGSLPDKLKHLVANVLSTNHNANWYTSSRLLQLIPDELLGYEAVAQSPDSPDAYNHYDLGYIVGEDDLPIFVKLIEPGSALYELYRTNEVTDTGIEERETPVPEPNPYMALKDEPVGAMISLPEEFVKNYENCAATSLFTRLPWN